MVTIYEEIKKEITSKKIVLLSICILFILGLLFGSLYITILGNDEKKEILSSVNNYFSSFSNITFHDKLNIFKNDLIKNLLYFIILWCLGLCILGLPIIFIMIFFKSFIAGFSIAGIFAKYKITGLIGILIYIFPNAIVTLLLSIFLGTYSSILSIRLVRESFTKKNLNFGSFMGKYFFVLLICILIIIICSLFDAFISPLLYKIFVNTIK